MNKILCTLGPSSLNKKFLKFSNKRINLLRLNLSHVRLKDLKKTIEFIKKYTTTPICIDTEGGQIRTKFNKKKYLKKNLLIKISKTNKDFYFYPNYINFKLKRGDLLDIGFEGLQVKILKQNRTFCLAKVLNSGYLEGNKGVHLKNRSIKIDYITQKDIQAIEIAKKLKIKHFALSFTRGVEDIKKFNNLLKKDIKIFKLETKSALKDLKNIFRNGKFFLIDRGDLSKEISIEQIPIAQRKILKLGRKMNKKIFVATNFLETMIKNNVPTRGEVNDIYNTLETGAEGLVLAAETAIGKNPVECILTLERIFKTFKKESSKI